MIRSATIAAWPSANTPALGVPTLVTSPREYTWGNAVSRVSGSTGIQPSTHIPESCTTSGARCTGTPRNRSKGSSRRSRYPGARASILTSAAGLRCDQVSGATTTPSTTTATEHCLVAPSRHGRSSGGVSPAAGPDEPLRDDLEAEVG